nr:hypothetical protein FFPRI1PSEUD_63460 [Pseudomonas sp. FFPRI_1]
MDGARRGGGLHGRQGPACKDVAGGLGAEFTLTAFAGKPAPTPAGACYSAANCPWYSTGPVGCPVGEPP